MKKQMSKKYFGNKDFEGNLSCYGSPYHQKQKPRGFRPTEVISQNTHLNKIKKHKPYISPEQKAHNHIKNSVIPFLKNMNVALRKKLLDELYKTFGAHKNVTTVLEDEFDISKIKLIKKPITSNLDSPQRSDKKPYPKNPFSEGVAEGDLKFKSDREYSFYRKFLKDTGLEFEQEKQYPFENAKWKSDFYITALDLHVEVCMVSPSVEIIKRYQTLVQPQSVYLNVFYEQKEVVKGSGGRWNPDKKKWYFMLTPDKAKTQLRCFGKWMSRKEYNYLMEEVPELDNQQSANYNRLKRLGEKLKVCKAYGVKMILAEEKRIDVCKDLLEIIAWSKQSY